MRYFKNAELTRLYNVSDKAVRNWIEGSQRGRFKLELITERNRVYIADSIHNSLILEELAERGRKFRNKRMHRDVIPLDNFYKQYTPEQQKDIINSLQKYHEIPQQYRYFGEGGRYWDAYLHKLYMAGNKNMLTSAISLLKLDQPYLDSIIGPYREINIIDVGVGNGLAARGLLEHLLNEGKMGRYIGIDCSPELLDLTQKNVESWFGRKVCAEMHIRDINHQRFLDIVPVNNPDSINLFLFLGGTLPNLREPDQGLRMIRDSMGEADLLITSDKLDGPNTRRFFDFNTETDVAILSERNKMLLNLLSIEESYYSVEQFFDEQLRSRIIQVRLKVDVTINFGSELRNKKIHLGKGKTILLFRSWEWTDSGYISFFEKLGLSQLRMAKTADEEYILLISRVSNSLESPVASTTR